MAIFGLEISNFIAILALCVAGVSSTLTAVTFIITHGRNRKSEQIKIAREIQDNLNVASKKIVEFRNNNNYADKVSIEDKSNYLNDLLSFSNSVLGSVRYFTYLVEQKEIDDTSVLNYHKQAILIHVANLENIFAFIEEKTAENTTVATRETSKVPELRGDVLRFRRVWESK
jgi:hypothetical protein